MSLAMREIRFNGDLLRCDAEDKGFTTAAKLAAKTKPRLSDQTILRFYKNEIQTAATLNACCRVLKTKPGRYRRRPVASHASSQIEAGRVS